jgi:hypothetical protein
VGGYTEFKKLLDSTEVKQFTKRAIITNVGHRYTTYQSFFTDNNLKDLLGKYRIGRDGFDNGDFVKVLFVGKHSDFPTEKPVVIELENGSIGLIEISGLKFL